MQKQDVIGKHKGVIIVNKPILNKGVITATECDEGVEGCVVGVKYEFKEDHKCKKGDIVTFDLKQVGASYMAHNISC